MARRDTTAQPQRGTRPGCLFDPARPSHRWWVAATVAVSGLLVSMNQTAMQIALPQIMTVFGLNQPSSLHVSRWTRCVEGMTGGTGGSRASSRTDGDMGAQVHALHSPSHTPYPQ